MMLKKISFAFALLSTFAIGCAAETAGLDEESVTADDDSQELSAAGKALIGSYIDDSGEFRGLVLTSTKVGQRNKFFADVDTNIRCFRAPCPTSGRIEGTFTAGPKTITFYSTTNAPFFAEHLFGRYNYLVQGAKFSLSRAGFAQSLEKVPSYCSASTASADCLAEDLIVPACLGQFKCSSQNRCNWSCGVHFPGCNVLDEQACSSTSRCFPHYGPSWCSADGRICSKDFAYKGCATR